MAEIVVRERAVSDHTGRVMDVRMVRVQSGPYRSLSANKSGGKLEKLTPCTVAEGGRHLRSHRGGGDVGT